MVSVRVHVSTPVCLHVCTIFVLDAKTATWSFGVEDYNTLGIYRISSKIHPPFLHTTLRAKWRGGLFFKDALSLDHTPPQDMSYMY